MFMGVKTDQVPLNQQSPAQIQAAVAAQYPGLLPDTCLNPSATDAASPFQGARMAAQDPSSPFQGVKEGETMSFAFANQQQQQ